MSGQSAVGRGAAGVVLVVVVIGPMLAVSLGPGVTTEED